MMKALFSLTSPIQTLREKVETLERSLNQMVMEFERDRQMSLAAAKRDLQMQNQECDRLNAILQLKCKELEQVIWVLYIAFLFDVVVVVFSRVYATL